MYPSEYGLRDFAFNQVEFFFIFEWISNLLKIYFHALCHLYHKEIENERIYKCQIYNILLPSTDGKDRKITKSIVKTVSTNLQETDIKQTKFNDKRIPTSNTIYLIRAILLVSKSVKQPFSFISHSYNINVTFLLSKAMKPFITHSNTDHCWALVNPVSGDNKLKTNCRWETTIFVISISLYFYWDRIIIVFRYTFKVSHKCTLGVCFNRIFLLKQAHFFSFEEKNNTIFE